MTATAEWHGTQQEGLELMQAVEHANPEQPLAAGQALFADQRVMDHLLFVRRTVTQFVVAEFTAEIKS